MGWLAEQFHAQIPWQPFPTSGQGGISLPLFSRQFVQYWTPIAVGNPPQEFKALVDLAWSDPFVPSVKCNEPESCDIHPLYNSSASSTYIADGRHVHMQGGGFWLRGNASIDSYHLAGVEIANQTFLEADIVHRSYFFSDWWYDALLPLARDTVPVIAQSNLSVPSVFQNSMAQGLLPRNVVGMAFPQLEGEAGQLDLGRTDPIFTEPRSRATELPMRVNVDLPGSAKEYIRGGWYVEAAAVRLDTKPEPLHYNLSGYIAWFHTEAPHSLLPTSFAEKMYAALDADSFFGRRCDGVEDLPELTLTLRGRDGRDEDFVFGGRDYLPREVYFPLVGEENCTLVFTDVEEIEPEVPNFIALGSWFMHKFYTEFDADDMMVRSKPAHTFIRTMSDSADDDNSVPFDGRSIVTRIQNYCNVIVVQSRPKGIRCFHAKSRERPAVCRSRRETSRIL
jgi:cathepsin D